MKNDGKRIKRLNALCLAIAGVLSIGFLSGCNRDSGSDADVFNGTLGMTGTGLGIDVGPMKANFTSDISTEPDDWFKHKPDIDGVSYTIKSWSNIESSIDTVTNDILNFTSPFSIKGVSHLIGYSEDYWSSFSDISDNDPHFKEYSVNSVEKVNSSDLEDQAIHKSQLQNISAGLITWQFQDVKEAEEFDLEQVVIELYDCSESEFLPVVLSSNEFDGVDDVEGSGYTYLHLSTLKPKTDQDWEYVTSQKCKVKFGFTVDGNITDPVPLSTVSAFNPGDRINVTLNIDAFSGDVGFTYDVALDWDNEPSDVEIDIPDKLDPTIPKDVVDKLGSDGLTNRQINSLCSNDSVVGVNVDCSIVKSDVVKMAYFISDKNTECDIAYGAVGNADYCVDIDYDATVNLQTDNDSNFNFFEHRLMAKKGKNATHLTFKNELFTESDYKNDLYFVTLDGAKAEQIPESEIFVDWSDQSVIDSSHTMQLETVIKLINIDANDIVDMDSIRYFDGGGTEIIQAPTSIEVALSYGTGGSPGAPEGSFVVDSDLVAIDFDLLRKINEKIVLFKALY
ncbi:ExoP galactose-binding-like domain-containing protein [Vibrio crassostreae]|nr:ExoP galactose-binding-like domain-containing protein [Vibrio crassostreae]